MLTSYSSRTRSELRDASSVVKICDYCWMIEPMHLASIGVYAPMSNAKRRSAQFAVGGGHRSIDGVMSFEAVKGHCELAALTREFCWAVLESLRVLTSQTRRRR